MSIEDIQFLKKNSIKQSYTFLVDSSGRDRRLFPEPNEYNVDFTVPFQNVIGMEVLDVSIPKTMYNIDYNNNRLYYYIAETEEENVVPILKNDKGEDIYDESVFSYIEVEPGDYTSNTFIDKLYSIFLSKQIDINFAAVSNPTELTNLIYFWSRKPFILDMHRSTLAEVLGFDYHTNRSPQNASKYTYSNEYNDKVGFEKLYHSVLNNLGFNAIYAPGMMYLIGDKYIILKCPEIEQHLYRSLSYSKYSLGLAKIRINSYGYNDEKTSFLKVPLREFHPIGKLSKITLRFETSRGTLYDFKGVNHNIVFAVYYYEPRQENIVKDSILNPEYNPNLINYLYTQEEQEGESDDENDFSRDDKEIYRKREQNYNKQGIDKKNKMVAYKLKQDAIGRENQYKNLIRKASTFLLSESDESANSSISSEIEEDEDS